MSEKRRKNSFTTKVVGKNVIKVSFDLVSNLHRLGTLVLADPEGPVYVGQNNIHATKPQSELADVLALVGTPKKETNSKKPIPPILEKVFFQGNVATIHKKERSPAWEYLRSDLEETIDSFLNQ